MPPAPQQSWLVIMMRVWVRFERFAWDVGGLLLLAIALMTLLAFILPETVDGILLTWWSNLLKRWLGWGTILVAFGLTAFGIIMLQHRYALRQIFKKPSDFEGGIVDQTADVSAGLQQIRWARVFILEATVFTALTLLAAVGGGSLDRAEAGNDGGLIGWALAELLGTILPPIWLVPVLGIVTILGLVYGLSMTGWIVAGVKKINKLVRTSRSKDLGAEPAVSVAPVKSSQSSERTTKTSKKRYTRLPPEYRKQFRVQSSDEKGVAPPRDDLLPPLKLLVGERSSRPDERNINLTAGLIEKTLAEFGVPAKVIDFQVGPTVTQFAVEPGYIERAGSDGDVSQQKIRVSQISTLSRDLALALSAERLRVQAPVPGRPYVGIEVPNTQTTVVRLRPILETEDFYNIGSPLAIALGRDVSGNPVAADLAAMPHMLIAGTTGSGKSVCIAALTTCLVMNNSPEDLRIVMIDPKMVELVRFNGLTHLYGKVETNIERILGVLRWVVVEMDRRYILLEKLRSRNIDTYNRKARRRKEVEVLPRIVVMIDELADLMMSAPDQTEHNLIRLAQMARATGIHLILATQRPSTDVVTGLIKANFPARISFAVASSVDSRVILDTPGAEHLLGRGDMLYLPPEASSPLRAQGVMVSDPEVERVITYWQKLKPPDEVALPPWEKMLADEVIMASRDDFIEKAIQVVCQSQRASASMLQRRLRIGYPRAARLMDELEDLGVVGPSRGGGREREVLIDPDDETG